MAKISYVILSREEIEGSELWAVAGKIDAHGTAAAITAFAREQIPEPQIMIGVELVAIPERSWRPRPIKGKQQLRLDLT